MLQKPLPAQGSQAQRDQGCSWGRREVLFSQVFSTQHPAQLPSQATRPLHDAGRDQGVTWQEVPVPAARPVSTMAHLPSHTDVGPGKGANSHLHGQSGLGSVRANQRTCKEH